MSVRTLVKSIQNIIVLTNPPFGGKEEDGIESNFPQHFRVGGPQWCCPTARCSAKASRPDLRST